jgi:hypothetical protein
MFENLSFCSQNIVATNFVLTVSSGCDLEEMDTECLQLFIFVCLPAVQEPQTFSTAQTDTFSITSTKNEHHHLYTHKPSQVCTFSH